MRAWGKKVERKFTSRYRKISNNQIEAVLMSDARLSSINPFDSRLDDIKIQGMERREIKEQDT